MLSNLMTTRRFAPLFWCQFFSAFNDNFLKNSLVFLIVYSAVRSASDSGALVQLAAAIFIFPFFILSALGGEIADRFDKGVVARRLKLVEIAVAAVAVAGFWLHSLPILFVALAGFGIIAALFGPIKYGILPDHLATYELPTGNALVEAATFIAILLGTIVGGIAARDGGNPAAFGVLMMVFAVACWGSAMMIPRTGEAAPNLKIDFNIARSTFALLRELKSRPQLWWGGLVTSWFWAFGATALSLLPNLVRDTLGGNEAVATAFLAVFSIAIAVGSGLASWLAHGRIMLAPTLVAAVLLGLFAIDLGIATFGLSGGQGALTPAEIFGSARGIRVTIDLAGMAIAGGLFIVPVFSAVQAWAGADRRARVIAAVNVLNAAFMVVSGLAVAALQQAGLLPAHLFLLLGLLSLGVAFAIARTMPNRPLRDFLSIIFRIFFRVEVKGLENVAKAGVNPIIALNHVSFLDAALALSMLDKEPVFAIDSTIAQQWWVKPFLHMTRALPIDPTKPWGTRTLIHAVQAGDPLIIFPEGRITVTGSLMKIYDGAGLIADKSGAFVVPVRIEGLEKTPFSRLDAYHVRKKLFPKVTVTIEPPVKLAVDPELKGKKRRVAAGAALYRIMSDLFFRTGSVDRTVVGALIEAAHEHGLSRVALEDPMGTLTYRKLLIGVSVLGRKLMAFAAEGEALGVMLPNANGAAVTVFAVMSGGRLPAMINFSGGAANVRAACKAAQVKTIVTSRAFVEKGRLENLIEGIKDDVRLVYLEDVRKTITTTDKLRGLMSFRRPLVERKPEGPAAILFTSGSEGLPKGVLLSHRNMLANAAQAEARIDFGRHDKVFNVLPMFHSFGLVVATVLPLVHGVKVFLYPSPLHYRIVPELVYGSNATILFATDTFLNGYARMANPYDFRSIRYLISGAEPVRPSTRGVYMEKFGVRILEGYGVTETGPALALNTAMFNRFGTVGRLFPGMEARLEPVEGVEGGGRLFVRGPSVMMGYLRAENPGVLEPPPDGWHDTGDIVDIDADGYVTIKGRAKRFAKVGGEMISLAAIELIAAELWPNAQTGIVTIPDARKGERIVLVTTQPNPTRAEYLAFARSRGASELAIPAEYINVDKLPLLGSGKVDNITLTKMVRERFQLEGAA
jgi:acyl-[acyl-carrier-protein]-phospholipid O-acyltransferase/long-chain-fatty-acid--[acyl-carrier-protein] ligase